MLRLQNISKSFSGIKALDRVSLDFNHGEVHVLCGENGAGKSTLMNIIMGNLQPDEGQIFWERKPVVINNVLAAQNLGIGIVYQERSLANALTIAENIFPVNMPVSRWGLINYPLLYRKTKNLLDELGLTTLSPGQLVSNISVAQKQMVEIAKAIAHQPSLLILDEPTASITHAETLILFQLIRRLRDKGTGIIYISHRMHEIKQIADRISVLKDGSFVGTGDSSLSTNEIIRMMVGRDIKVTAKQSNARHEVKLEVNDLSGKGFSDISFQLYAGEVLGFAGLEGSGKSLVAKAIFGDVPINKGTVYKDGKILNIKHPLHAMMQHIVYVPEERKTEALFMDMSVAENISSTKMINGLYNESQVNNNAIQLCDEFNVRTSSVARPVRTLSGGNQQKLVLGKLMALNPEVLLINEPTHGVDVASKAEIYPLFSKLTGEGKSIVLISGDLTELLSLCDRIAVMREGKLTAILSRNEATEENITALASGSGNAV